MTRTWMLLGSMVAVACAGDTARVGHMVVRDSAGISIVENGGPAWGPGEEWSLSTEPVTTIGVTDGPEEYQLFRANHAVRLSHGDILVVNGGTFELRFYDSTGTYLRSVGREGSGPGEFKRMGPLSRFHGDSLLLFDFGNSRMVVLGPDGAFGRTFTMAAPPGASPGFVVAPFPDGSLLAESYPVTASGVEPGLTRSRGLYGRYDAEGQLIDTLVRRFSYELYGGTVGGRLVGGSRPFGRRGISAVGTDEWYYGSSDAFEIEVYTMEGRLTRLIRRDVPNRPITAEIADDYVQRTLEGTGPMGDAMRRWRAEIPLPETMPAYRGFVVDDEDNLWVQEYRLRDEPGRWVVFDPEGRFLGQVAMPTDRGSPTHIGRDFVVGTWNTELDVEQVRMYRLRKPPRE